MLRGFLGARFEGLRALGRTVKRRPEAAKTMDPGSQTRSQCAYYLTENSARVDCDEQLQA